MLPVAVPSIFPDRNGPDSNALHRHRERNTTLSTRGSDEDSDPMRNESDHRNIRSPSQPFRRWTNTKALKGVGVDDNALRSIVVGTIEGVERM